MMVREQRTSEMNVAEIDLKFQNPSSSTFANHCGQLRSESKGICVFKPRKAQ